MLKDIWAFGLRDVGELVFFCTSTCCCMFGLLDFGWLEGFWTFGPLNV